MAKEFFIWKNEKPDGPYSLSKIQQMLQTWQVKEDTLVCEEGKNEWLKLGFVLEHINHQQSKRLKSVKLLLLICGIIYGGGFIARDIDQNEFGGYARTLRLHVENFERAEKEFSNPFNGIRKMIREEQAEIMARGILEGWSSAEIARRAAAIASEAEAPYKENVRLAKQRLAEYEKKLMTDRIIHGSIASSLILGSIFISIMTRKKHLGVPVSAPSSPHAPQQLLKAPATPPVAITKPPLTQLMLVDHCPACNQGVEYPPELAGQVVKCPGCQGEMTLA